MYKICFYVPTTNLEEVKNALFDAGAGQIGNYDRCSWEIQGTGQFRPLAGSTPYIGNNMQIEKVKEYKVELVCDKSNIKQAIKALIHSHPYETPAYQVTEIVNI